ncbi:LOW QUALITY PROTEIN: hypothetical protein YC2023_077605 [Brassica napus]
MPIRRELSRYVATERNTRSVVRSDSFRALVRCLVFPPQSFSIYFKKVFIEEGFSFSSSEVLIVNFVVSITGLGMFPMAYA